MAKKDTYEEHACGFLNESECEEELDDEGLNIAAFVIPRIFPVFS